MPYEEVTTVTYATAATAKGGRKGNVRSEDGVVDLPLGPPGSTTNPRANPETLFASGYAACFSSALNFAGRRAGLDISESTVTASVTLGRTDTGVGLAVDLVADVPTEVDRETARRLLDEAHHGCPYSKATRGNIPVTVSLAP